MENTLIKNVLKLITIAALSYLASMHPFTIKSADTLATFFVTFLKWCSIPLISFSILSTTKNIESPRDMLHMGKSVLRYTLFTTFIAGLVALGYFLLLNPNSYELSYTQVLTLPEINHNIFGLLLISSLVISLIIAMLVLALPKKIKVPVERLIAIGYNLTFRTVSIVLKIMPLVIIAFATLLIKDLGSLNLKAIIVYLACITLSNLTQAIIVLPAMLKRRNIAIGKLFKGMFKALNAAFWSKSSAVALPIALECAKDLKIDSKVANFSFPLCITINMNACAAFILTTVLFVSTANGAMFSATDFAIILIVSTLGAIGNAGVPMGCYTISTAILAYMNVPLYILGIILPFYSIIDMLESAINVWSDACVTSMVAHDLKYN